MFDESENNVSINYWNKPGVRKLGSFSSTSKLIEQVFSE